VEDKTDIAALHGQSPPSIARMPHGGIMSRTPVPPGVSAIFNNQAIFPHKKGTLPTSENTHFGKRPPSSAMEMFFY